MHYIILQTYSQMEQLSWHCTGNYWLANAGCFYRFRNWFVHSFIQPEEIVTESLNMLLDRELPNEVKKKISEVVLSHEKVYGFRG